MRGTMEVEECAAPVEVCRAADPVRCAEAAGLRYVTDAGREWHTQRNHSMTGR